MGIKDIQNKVIGWNCKFPLDKWYREKYRIPFMSKQHRESSFCNIRFEWEEYKIMSELEVENKEPDEYVPNIGEFFRSDTYKEPQTDEDFIEAGEDFFKKFLESNGESGG